MIPDDDLYLGVKLIKVWNQFTYPRALLLKEVNELIEELI